MKKEVGISSATALISDIEGMDDHEGIIEIIKHSQKFVLGHIDNIPKPKKYPHGQKLPYPISLFEYVIGDCKANGMEKHILLCICDGVNNDIVYILPFGKVHQIGEKWLSLRVIIKFDTCKGEFLGVKVPKLVGKNKDDVLREMVAGTLGALSRILSVLGCNNIYIEKKDVPVKLQKKRIKQNKEPFYSFHVLKIKNTENKNIKNNKGGHHASPRVHFRRGHIRNLPDGGTTWVTSCIVGNSGNGFVGKDYAVGASC